MPPRSLLVLSLRQSVQPQPARAPVANSGLNKQPSVVHQTCGQQPVGRIRPVPVVFFVRFVFGARESEPTFASSCFRRPKKHIKAGRETGCYAMSEGWT